MIQQNHQSKESRSKGSDTGSKQVRIQTAEGWKRSQLKKHLPKIKSASQKTKS